MYSKANWIIPDANLAILRRHPPAKSTRYLAPRRLIFGIRAFGFVVSHERKDSGVENTSGLRHADLFLGGPRLPPEVVSVRLNFSARGPKKIAFTRQKSSGPCPILLVRVPKFRSAVPKMKVVSKCA